MDVLEEHKIRDTLNFNVFNPDFFFKFSQENHSALDAIMFAAIRLCKNLREWFYWVSYKEIS